MGLPPPPPPAALGLRLEYVSSQWPPRRIKAGTSLVVGLPGPLATKASVWNHCGPRSIWAGASLQWECWNLRRFGAIGAPAASR